VLKDKTTGQDLPPTQQVFRELFYVPERISDVAWSFCGVDMSGIELRMLAHFAYPYDGGEYATIVLDGDPHAANAEAWGVSRTIAKTGIYAWLYGAGDKKLGRTLHPYLITERDQMAAGRKGRATIAERFIGLGRLVERVRDKASAQGYLTGLDGRTIPIRADYSALNNVLQTGAAVAAKVWINNVNRSLLEWLGPQGWNGKWAAQLWVHDELQIACGTGIAEYVKDVMIQGIEDAGRMLNLSVPLAGAGRIGRTWADTH
jgi:DNA polymerase I-like protein with 3'-5' exonuclease and polymerase domains